MLSLAFIISFVLSAVVMVVGIVIYSDISDDLGEVLGGDPILISNGTVGVTGGETILSKNGGFDSSTGKSMSNNVGRGNNLVAQLKYTSADGLITGDTITHIRVIADSGATSMRLGLYNSNILVAQTGLVNGLPLGSPIWHELETPYEIQAGDSLHFGGTSLTGSSTVLRSFDIPYGSTAYIVGAPTFAPTYPVLPPVGQFNDIVESGANFGYELKQFKETVIAVDPVYDIPIPEQFTQADNIALTVIGVMPIALFFGLFAILSPRVGE